MFYICTSTNYAPIFLKYTSHSLHRGSRCKLLKAWLYLIWLFPLNHWVYSQQVLLGMLKVNVWKIETSFPNKGGTKQWGVGTEWRRDSMSLSPSQWAHARAHLGNLMNSLPSRHCCNIIALTKSSRRPLDPAVVCIGIWVLQTCKHDVCVL